MIELFKNLVGEGLLPPHSYPSGACYANRQRVV